jgi:hypothetical protein
MIPEGHRLALERRGFVLLPAVVPIGQCARLVDRLEQLYASEGDQAGSEFRQEPGARRLANLVDKDHPGDPLLAACIDHPTLVPYVAAVIGDRFKLSSLNARSANPGNQSVQPLHADGGAVHDPRGFWVCNLLLMLDDFNADNGALRTLRRPSASFDAREAGSRRGARARGGDSLAGHLTPTTDPGPLGNPADSLVFPEGG